MYWNILFLILSLLRRIVARTITLTTPSIPRTFAISCFIDLLVVAYFSYLSYKMLNMVLPADDFDKKKLATLKMSNMVAGASIILGDLLCSWRFRLCNCTQLNALIVLIIYRRSSCS